MMKFVAVPASIVSIWDRVPVLVRAILAGIVMASLGTVPWALLAEANLSWWIGFPWSVAVMSVYLYFYWKLASKVKNTRAKDVPADVWALAIGAGILGLWALILFQSVYSRLVVLPTESLDHLSNVPGFTLTMLIIMGSIVAGVVEESSFRGHMQGPLEQKYGPVVAILVTGVVFGFAHFTHEEVTIVLMPWYMGVAAVYGTMAYMTRSILPGLVLHAGGNMLNAINVFATGRSEWQTPSVQPKLVWETGADVTFWISLTGFLLLAGVAVAAYIRLGQIAAKAR